MDAALDRTGFFRAASFGSPPRCCASTTAAASATANINVKSAVTQRIVVIPPDQAIKWPGNLESLLQVLSAGNLTKNSRRVQTPPCRRCPKIGESCEERLRSLSSALC